jgi:TolB-like protein
MGAVTASQVATPAGAVFLSYASQDGDAARRICDALRAVGIEVWFDQSELRGGDVWDQKIRRQIHDCALFIPVISRNTASRREGYFRLEWDLADQRSHMMARDQAFIVPVCLDATPDTGRDVPESFHRVQWTRLPGGETPPTFVQRVQSLLSSETLSALHSPVSAVSRVAPAGTEPVSASWASKPILVAIVIVFAALAYLVTDKFWLSKHAAATSTGAAAPQPVIPDKSIAVLPFTDLSEKRDQEYFADGLCEELIDLLGRIQGLIVPARTSSFYFKGKAEDVPTIARRLRVAHVLEGSVRKFGTRLRVTAQLVRADTGYHLWSETYDRQVDDLFKIQDEIAESVVKALQLSILNPEVPRSVPTVNSEAHTLYLHALSLARQQTSADSIQAYKDLRRALTLDPKFVLAWCALAELLTDDKVEWKDAFGKDPVSSWQEARDVARDAAAQALHLDSKLAEAHLAMGLVLYNADWNWEAASRELKQAQELDPANAAITEAAASLANTMGHFNEGLRLANRAANQDPLGVAYWDIGAANHRLGDLKAAAAAYQHLTELYPTGSAYRFRHALVLLSLGDAQAALAEMEHEAAPWYRQLGLPLVLETLGRKSDAERELAVALSKYPAMAYQFSYVYAARKDHDSAISWLERALEQRDLGLLSIKGDPMLRDIEQDPRFVALLRKMNLAE